MSHEKDPELRALLLSETPNAIHVCKLHSAFGSKTWWIPRGQIGYLRKDKVDSAFVGGGVNTHVTFTIPEWLIEKKECWELVP